MNRSQRQRCRWLASALARAGLSAAAARLGTEDRERGAEAEPPRASNLSRRLRRGDTVPSASAETGGPPPDEDAPRRRRRRAQAGQRTQQACNVRIHGGAEEQCRGPRRRDVAALGAGREGLERGVGCR